MRGGNSKQARTGVKAYEYDMVGHAEGCVERYLELAHIKMDSLKKVDTPCIDDHALPEKEFETTGSLAL